MDENLFHPIPKNHAAISCTMHDLWNCEIDRDRFLGDHQSGVRMLAHTLIAALRTDAQHVFRAPITKFRYAIFNRTLVSAMTSTPRAMIRRDAHPDGFCEKTFFKNACNAHAVGQRERIGEREVTIMDAHENCGDRACGG